MWWPCRFSRFPLHFRNLALAGLLLAVGLIVTTPMGVTRAADVFSVRDMVVDATAGSATDARKVALTNGQKKAFRALLEDRKSVV